jgi:hypothetical protein
MHLQPIFLQNIKNLHKVYNLNRKKTTTETQNGYSVGGIPYLPENEEIYGT